MSQGVQPRRPAWQTEELDDEWPDDCSDDEQDAERDGQGHENSSLSLTAPRGTLQLRDFDPVSSDKPGESSSTEPTEPIGTFVIRHDAPTTHINPMTPGAKKNAHKDFFSPMALERMFEPPSPPKPSILHVPLASNPTNAPFQPSRLSQVHLANSSLSPQNSALDDCAREPRRSDEIVETDMPNMISFDGRKPSLNCQFTFAVARQTPPQPQPHFITPSGLPQAESTPLPTHPPSSTIPATDPRLRLFQFQYDTFTRDHLSAMVDSIAINSPSISNPDHFPGSLPSPSGLSPVTDPHTTGGSSDFRSAKRIKLSPVSDFFSDGDGINPVGRRPKARTDWVGESKSLMAQIKEARDFSTISSVTTTKRPGQVFDGQPHDRLPPGAQLSRPPGE